MRNLCTWVLLALLLFLSCSDSGTAPRSVTIVRTGTSFGECAGWCFQDVEIRGIFATFLLRQWTPGQAEYRGTSRLTLDEWRSLVRALDMEALAALPDVLGCPDCADGGAEWIEVEHEGTGKRVTFEFGSQIPPIQSLLDAARALREEILPDSAAGGSGMQGASDVKNGG